MKIEAENDDLVDTMAERSKALVLGTSLRAWVRIPLVSLFSLINPRFSFSPRCPSPSAVGEIHRLEKTQILVDERH